MNNILKRNMLSSITALFVLKLTYNREKNRNLQPKEITNKGQKNA